MRKQKGYAGINHVLAVAAAALAIAFCCLDVLQHALSIPSNGGKKDQRGGEEHEGGQEASRI